MGSMIISYSRQSGSLDGYTAIIPWLVNEH